MKETEKLRIDKYLWAIRLFKTRSLATEACKAGRIKLNGQNLKPSSIVKIGEVYSVSKGIEKKIIEVVDFSYNRTDSPTALTKYKDITPEEDTQAFKSMFHSPNLKRDRGTGRPTKKDRRETDDLIGGLFEEKED
ncbi:RNA-binding S4 domain-containing protein [Pedobacter mucosus]|uniref:RNA-binding S4 domain-containing protein n=1 Tax=Pedobacter mucosus TaxID=2895286 RepID=UPI001EE49F7C|nr:RNA-binding S4 domain-containing protein [Pedobacter mucosus]UKT62352.1 RNA-binding S4 domain-containing protein [Pedobacter mucosus]